MSRVYKLAPKIGAPMPVHMIGPEAEASRRNAHERKTQETVDAIVTKIDTRRPEPDASLPVPPNATKLQKLALALGYDVRVVRGYVTMNAGKANERIVPSLMVAGINHKRGKGFRAVWAGGSAWAGTWYERGTGMPFGEPVGVTAVMERVGR